MSAGSVSLQCAAFGVPFLLSANSAELLAQMRERAPHDTNFTAPASAGGVDFAIIQTPEAYFLLVHGEPVAEAAAAEPLLDRLARDLMVHVADHAPDRVFVHAGVVGWRDRALLLPGTSFAGKTTLVAALVRAGATYYSDEYAVLDELGRAHPYTRDLQMRLDGSARQTSVPVAQLNGRAGVEPLPVALIVFTEYAEGGQWQPEPVSPGMAVLEMLRHAIPVQRSPARVMATLAKVMERAVALRSPRAEADRAASCILLAMERTPRI